jgi:hypothetical protein
MTILISDLNTSQNLDRKTMATIVGGFYWEQARYLEAFEDIIVSCYKGVCGEYPVGNRTDEAR